MRSLCGAALIVATGLGGANAGASPPATVASPPMIDGPGPWPKVDCPTECLDESTPWWYNVSCRGCQGPIEFGRASTWTCPPTWPPKRLFVIFSMQRSATNTACYLVDSLPDTRCDGELLNPGLWQRRTGRPLDPDPLKSMRTAFEATYSSAGNAPCTWGFNLFPQQVSQPWLLSWLWETVDRAIILERSNGEIVARPNPPSPTC